MSVKSEGVVLRSHFRYHLGSHEDFILALKGKTSYLTDGNFYPILLPAYLSDRLHKNLHMPGAIQRHLHTELHTQTGFVILPFRLEITFWAQARHHEYYWIHRHNNVSDSRECPLSDTNTPRSSESISPSTLWGNFGCAFYGTKLLRLLCWLRSATY